MVLTALFVATTVGLTHPRPISADTVPAGDILFSSDRANDGKLNLYIYHYKTTNAFEKLTTSPYADLDAKWSPGGTGFAFTRYSNSNFDDGEIWYFNGSSFKRLTNNTADDYAPTFSPDGARIAFASNRDGDYEIFSMAIDGTDIKQLTRNTVADLDPTWSPDRTKIAFSSSRDGNGDVWLMNRDGTSPTNLTQASTGSYFGNDFADDGSAIAYHRITVSGADYPENLGFVTPAGVETNWASTLFYDEYPEIFNGYFVLFDSDYVSRGGDEFNLYITQTDSLSYIQPITSGHYDVEASWRPVPAFPLVDARFSTFNLDIQWVYAAGITSGCSPERYCPDDLVTRAQMASFLARALELPPTATDYFTDDNGNTHEANINKIRAANITTGCAPGLYCPNGLVTRGQMAAFLVRALALPAATQDYFTDDDGTTFEDSINRLREANLTTGCGGTSFCPNGNVTRGQMAAFLHRAFGM